MEAYLRICFVFMLWFGVRWCVWFCFAMPFLCKIPFDKSFHRHCIASLPQIQSTRDIFELCVHLFSFCCQRVERMFCHFLCRPWHVRFPPKHKEGFYKLFSIVLNMQCAACPFCKVAARMANGAFRTLCSRAKHLVMPNRYRYTYIWMSYLQYHKTLDILGRLSTPKILYKFLRLAIFSIFYPFYKSTFPLKHWRFEQFFQLSPLTALPGRPQSEALFGPTRSKIWSKFAHMLGHRNPSWAPLWITFKRPAL